MQGLTVWENNSKVSFHNFVRVVSKPMFLAEKFKCLKNKDEYNKGNSSETFSAIFPHCEQK